MWEMKWTDPVWQDLKSSSSHLISIIIIHCSLQFQILYLLHSMLSLTQLILQFTDLLIGIHGFTHHIISETLSISKIELNRWTAGSRSVILTYSNLFSRKKRCSLTSIRLSILFLSYLLPSCFSYLLSLFFLSLIIHSSLLYLSHYSFIVSNLPISCYYEAI